MCDWIIISGKSGTYSNANYAELLDRQENDRRAVLTWACDVRIFEDDIEHVRLEAVAGGLYLGLGESRRKEGVEEFLGDEWSVVVSRHDVDWSTPLRGKRTHGLDEDDTVQSVDGVPCSADVEGDVCGLALEEGGVEVSLEGVGGEAVGDGEAARRV